MAYGVAVEAQVGCPKCEGSVFLGALVERVRCVACGHVVVLEPDHWKTLLAEAMREAASWPILGARKGTVSIETITVRAHRIRQDPTFRETKTPIPVADVEAALARGWIDNPDGTRPATVRTLPQTYRAMLPGVLWLAEEDPGLLVAAGALREVPPLPEPKGFSVPCLKCGGPLDLRGAGRLVTCSHCRNVAFVADELWDRLHPDARPHRWYLWQEGSARPKPRDEAAQHDPHDQRHLPTERRFDPSSAYWVKARIRHRCASCDSPLPLPAVAPAVACSRCHTQHDVSEARWADHIVDMGRVSERNEGNDQDEDDPGMKALEEAAASVAQYVRRPPTLEDGSELSVARALAAADGEAIDGMLVRRLPERYRAWLPGVELLVGEAPHAVAGHDEPEQVPGSAQTGVTFGCPGCGGSLSPDGRSRMIECPYCDRGLGIPDDVWLKLHPPQGSHWFHFLYDPRLRMSTFASVDAIAPATGGGLFVAGDAEDGADRLLWSLEASLRAHWMVEMPGGSLSSPRMAASPDGDLLVWQDTGARTEVHRFDRADGTYRGCVNVEEAELHGLDGDGRLVGIQRGTTPSYFVAVRVDPSDGSTTPIWPEGTGAKVLGFLKGVLDLGDPPSFKRLGATPSRLAERQIEVIPGAQGRVTLRLDRAIATWSPGDDAPTRAELPCATEQNVHVAPDDRLVLLDPEAGRIVAVSRSGEVEPLADADSAGGRLHFRDDDTVIVDPDDGTVTVAGSDGSLQRYAADGTPTFINWRARSRARS